MGDLRDRVKSAGITIGDYQKEPFIGRAMLKISLAVFRRRAAEDHKELQFFMENFAESAEGGDGGREGLQPREKARQEKTNAPSALGEQQKGGGPSSEQAKEKLTLGKDFELRYRVEYRNRERIGSSKGQIITSEEA